MKKIIFVILFFSFLGTLYAQDNLQLVQEHYSKGNDYYDAGRYLEAEAEYQQALDLLSEEEQAAEPKKSTDYIITLGDVLFVSVWQDKELSQEVTVRPDGKFSYPLIGDIQAEGLTIPQLDEEITSRLKEYIQNPEVFITLRKLGGKRVIILGQVLGPGVYTLSGSRTIMEAIALAGGFTRDAVPSSTVLIRGGFDKPNAQRINLSKIFSGKMRNFALQSEDIIFIPRNFISNLNYFMTQIIEPLSQGSGAYQEMWTFRRPNLGGGTSE